MKNTVLSKIRTARPVAIAKQTRPSAARVSAFSARFRRRRAVVVAALEARHCVTCEQVFPLRFPPAALAVVTPDRGQVTPLPDQVLGRWQVVTPFSLN